MGKFILKRKNYAIPLAAAASLASGAITGASMLSDSQNHKEQLKQNEQLAKEQEKQNEQLTKALNKVAEAAKNNPSVAASANDLMSQRSFSVLKAVTTAAKGVGGMIKDVGKVSISNGRGKSMVGGVVAGAGLGTGAYVANKFISSDAKKSGIPLDQLAAANTEPTHPMMPATAQRSYSIPTAVKGAGKFLKGHWKSAGLMATMAAVPTVAGYMSEKQAYKDQIASTQSPSTNPMLANRSVLSSSGGARLPQTGMPSSFQAQQKSFANIAAFARMARRGWNRFKSHPGQSSLSWVSKNIAFGGGHKGVQRFGNDLIAAGSKSGNAYTQKLGNFIVNNPKTALTGSIATGTAVMSATFGGGEKLAKGAFNAVDKNAFAYDKAKQQQVQQNVTPMTTPPTPMS